MRALFFRANDNTIEEIEIDGANFDENAKKILDTQKTNTVSSTSGYFNICYDEEIFKKSIDKASRFEFYHTPIVGDLIFFGTEDMNGVLQDLKKAITANYILSNLQNPESEISVAEATGSTTQCTM